MNIFKKIHHFVWWIQVSFQRFAGRAPRGACLQLCLQLASQVASQVNVLGDRVQSCICWSAETGALADAREHNFANLLVLLALEGVKKTAIPVKRRL